MESETPIPEGWVSVPLNQLVSPSTEKVEPADDPDAFYIGLEHIEPNTTRIVGHGFARDTKSTKTRFISGSILYGKLRPYLNKVSIPDFDGVCSTDILVFPPSDAADTRYLMRFLSTSAVVDFATHQSSGMELPRTNYLKLGQLQIPIPPLAEQRRIVARLEALLADTDQVRGRLDAVEEAMQRFRQAVLGAACSGRLTEGWREEHIVLQETSWELSKLQDMGNWSTGGTPPRQIKSFFAGNIPWVKSGDLNDGVIADTEERISKEGLDNSNAKILPVGTISMALYGATIGKVGILGIEAATNQACANCIVNKEKIINKYLFYFLIEQRQSFIDAGQGGAQPNLTNKIVREWPIYLPSLPEQQEIVRRVEALFALADRIEGEVARALERVEALREAVLAKAFRGELVPTEVELARREGREYEPAAVLLERVRAGREDGHTKEIPTRNRRSSRQSSLPVENCD